MTSNESFRNKHKNCTHNYEIVKCTHYTVLVHFLPMNIAFCFSSFPRIHSPNLSTITTSIRILLSFYQWNAGCCLRFQRQPQSKYTIRAMGQHSKILRFWNSYLVCAQCNVMWALNKKNNYTVLQKQHHVGSESQTESAQTHLRSYAARTCSASEMRAPCVPMYCYNS